MTILIYHTAFIGDLILLTAPIYGIKKRYPDARILLITTPIAAPLFSLFEFPIEIIQFDKRKKHKGLGGLLWLTRELRKTNADYMFIPHRYLRSSVIGLLSGARKVVGYEEAPLSFLFSNKVTYNKSLHEIDRLNSIFQSELLFQAEYLPNLSPNKKQIPESILESLKIKGKRIGIAPGSVWKTKTYPKEKYSQLIKLLLENEFQIILIGSKEEVSLADYLISQNKQSINDQQLINTTGMMTLPQSISLISELDLLISNDSAPQHFAMAVKTPVLTIYGATIPGFGFFPRGEKDTWIETLNLACRPCGIHGGNSCPIKTFDCMENIQPIFIFEKIIKILES